MSDKKKIAVLGGGTASLTAALYLTSTPALRERYEVTVYQQGWRLGGKGASGRNRAIAHRIEEHGLHIWMGFYENAIRMMRAVFTEADRPPSVPLRTFEDAFVPHSYIVLAEKIRGKDEWWPWTFDFPTNRDRPGEGATQLGAYSAATTIARWMLLFWLESPYARAVEADEPARFRALERRVEALVGNTVTKSQERLHAFFNGVGLDGRASERAFAALERVLRAMSAMPDEQTQKYGAAVVVPTLEALLRVLWRILEPTVHTRPESHQLWVSMNLASAVIRGIFTDAIAHAGWDSIDHLDLREWLAKHGANEITLDSAPIRAIYDLAFGYVGGDTRRGGFAAGSAMRGMLRMLYTYKGSIFYKMQAGMGDVVFAPLYEVLRARGVRFEFFHRVQNLGLGDDNKTIDRIDGVQQAQLRSAAYEPLYATPDGLPCWPSTPLFEQIVDGDELESSGVDFESRWSPRWKHEAPFTLVRGRDFDEVVLGISIGAFRDVCPELIAANERFGAMCDRVATVNTQAMQLWLEPDLEGLGWKRPPRIEEHPVLGTFVEPIDTWAAMDQLLSKEFWPEGHEPKSVAYFCGPYDGEEPIPASEDRGYPARELDRYRSIATSFLKHDIASLWPKTAHPTEGFDWSTLVDPEQREGEARLASQYLRVNVDPSERYVLSVPGSTQYRLRPGDSGFDNLVLAGDWTYNVVNAGCVEAAVSSGMAAARALCGTPEEIIGEHGG
ncbi:MAG: NAD(P)-binding protein [Myxococcales bacterium]|nr:NAD(P)-binding protein [Myxococcales bacterium]